METKGEDQLNNGRVGESCDACTDIGVPDVSVRLIGPSNDTNDPRQAVVDAGNKHTSRLQFYFKMCYGAELILCVPTKALSEDDWGMLMGMKEGTIALPNRWGVKTFVFEIAQSKFAITCTETKTGPALRLVFPTCHLRELFRQARGLLN